jgi:hypothetical protein
MEDILAEYQTPQLGTLVKMCERLGTTPTDLMRQGKPEDTKVSVILLKMAGNTKKGNQKATKEI